MSPELAAVLAELSTEPNPEVWLRRRVFSIVKEGVLFSSETRAPYAIEESRWRVRDAAEALENLVSSGLWPFPLEGTPRWACEECAVPSPPLSRSMRCAVCSGTGLFTRPSKLTTILAVVPLGSIRLRALDARILQESGREPFWAHVEPRAVGVWRYEFGDRVIVRSYEVLKRWGVIVKRAPR